LFYWQYKEQKEAAKRNFVVIGTTVAGGSLFMILFMILFVMMLFRLLL